MGGKYKPGARVGKDTYKKRKEKAQKEMQAAIATAAEAERERLLGSQRVAKQLCHARVWAGGLGSQCPLPLPASGKYCHKHAHEDQRKFGDVSEPMIQELLKLRVERDDYKTQLLNLQNCRDWVSAAVRSGMSPPPTAKRRIKEIAGPLQDP